MLGIKLLLASISVGVCGVITAVCGSAEFSVVLGCVAVILIVAAFLVRERGEAYDRKEKPYSEGLPEKPAEEKVEPKEDEPETRSKNG